MVDEKKEQLDFLIVTELPKTSYNLYEAEDGKKYDLITLNEAVKEILEGVRAIKKTGGY